MAISAMNEQLASLHRFDDEDNSDGECDEVESLDSDEQSTNEQSTNEQSINKFKKEINDDDILSEEVEGYDDEEVEYVIEYETVSEDEDANEANENENKNNNVISSTTLAQDNIEQYVTNVSEQHTKIKLMAILKEHNLSTFGNKDTLIKRIMTIDNFESVLQLA